MPVGAAFNVLILAAAKKVNASPINSEQYYTVLPTAKGRPDAILLFTHMGNPYPKSDSIYVEKNQALDYPASSDPKDPNFNKWYIYHVDNSPPLAAGYFIVDTATIPVALGAVALSHTATAGNSSGSATKISESAALHSASNVVFISQVQPEPGAGKVRGVYFSGGDWVIFNEDISDMIVGDKFNVLMFPGQIP